MLRRVTSSHARGAPAAIRTWIEVPTVVESPTSAGRPKYPIVGSPFVVYKGTKAYAMVTDNSTQQPLLHYPDVRLLDPVEVNEFESTLRVPLPQPDGREPGRQGLGEVIHWFTKMLGINECGSCQKRRRSLNRVIVWGWWRKGAPRRNVAIRD